MKVQLSQAKKTEDHNKDSAMNLYNTWLKDSNIADTVCIFLYIRIVTNSEWNQPFASSKF